MNIRYPMYHGNGNDRARVAAANREAMRKFLARKCK